QEKDKENLSIKFLTETGFLQELTSDKTDNYTKIEDELIEEPGYFNFDFSELNNEQKSEYKKAFGPNSNLQLVRKYIYVRLHSLLKSIISYKDLNVLGKSLIELEVLKLLKAQRSSVNIECEELIKLINYFKSLTKDHLNERLNLLSELDTHAMALADTKTENITFINPSDIIFKININNQYYNIAKLSIERLKSGLKTGKIESKDEENVRSKSWDSDLEKIEKISNKHGDMKLFHILKQGKENPEMVSNVLKPYVDDLLSLGEEISNVAELQVMYWVDKLSIAYVRMKDYKNASELFERIYKLPEEYWGRSGNSEKKVINNRYKKCLKEVLTKKIQ
ncbi:MAG: hypothetical protein SGI89_05605, partial [bacterium]|nr:hypothetical protein [bacterium]